MVINDLTYNSLLTMFNKENTLAILKIKDRILFVFHEVAVLLSIRMYSAIPQICRKQHCLLNVNGNAWLSTVYVLSNL